MVRAGCIFLVVLVFGVGGCTTRPPEPPDATAEFIPRHKPPPPKQTVVRKPADRVTPKEETPPAPLPATVSVADVPLVAAPPPAQGPFHLIGLDEAETRRLVGAPAEVVERAPAVVWAYESAGCRLELSFYMDMASQALRVLTTEAKPKGEPGLTGDACVGSVRTATP
jgi:hypothetical protein